MNLCKSGDKLLKRNGMRAVYVERMDRSFCPHVVRDCSGFATRTNEGKVADGCNLMVDYDIVGFAPKRKFF